MELIQRLRRAREEAGLTLADLSSRTKIKVPILEAIEAGEFHRVPGGLFVRGFLRAYAKEVRLEPESVVEQYFEEFEAAPSEPVEALPYVHNERNVRVAPDDSPWSWRKAWPAAMVGGVLIGVFTALGQDPSVSPAIEAGAVGTSGQVAAVAPEPPARPDSLTLDIHAKREVWVALTADGHKAIYRVLQPNERAKVQARQEIAARIGDAEAFEYTINGLPGKPLGAPAEVKDVLITPDNYQSFRRQ